MKRPLPYGIQYPPDPEARDFWDEHLEYNPLRTNHDNDTMAGRLVALRLENAGDMLREMGKDVSDIGYFTEKLDRIRKSLTDPGWKGPLSPTDRQHISLIKSQIGEIPTRTPLTRQLKGLMINLLDRNTAAAGKRLDAIERVTRGTKRKQNKRSTSTVPKGIRRIG